MCTVLGNEAHEGYEENNRVQNASIQDYSQDGPDNTCLWGKRRNLAAYFPDAICQQSWMARWSRMSIAIPASNGNFLTCAKNVGDQCRYKKCYDPRASDTSEDVLFIRARGLCEGVYTPNPSNCRPQYSLVWNCK